MPLDNIWSAFREWGVMTGQQWPESPERTEQEILAALPALCRRRGELIRAAKTEREQTPRWAVVDKLEKRIDEAVMRGDVTTAAVAVREKRILLDNWERDTKARQEKEREIEMEHARVGDRIQTLIDRLSGL